MSASVRCEVISCSTGCHSSLVLELKHGDTVSSIMQECGFSENLCLRKGAWQLLEKWSNCKRALSLQEDMFMLNGEWGDLICASFQLKQKKMRKKRKVNRTKKKAALFSHPKLFLKKCTHKRLHCAKWVMVQALRQNRKKYSNLLLNRIVKQDPLWGPLEPTPLDSLQADLNSKKTRNLKLSSEIADLNITSTRLRNETHILRQKEQELTKRLTQLQDEVSVKREEKDRRGPKDLTQVQTDIIKLRRELETRNRLNASHTSKLKTQKEFLAEKKKYLEGRQNELNAVEQLQPLPFTAVMMKKSAVDDFPEGVDEPDVAPSVSSDQLFHTCIAEKRDPKVSSTSKKRHMSKFEARTKQLVEEEGISFRKMQSQLKFEPADMLSSQLSEASQTKMYKADELASSAYSKSAVYLHTEGPDVLSIPKEEERWYINSQEIPSGDNASPAKNAMKGHKLGNLSASNQGPTTLDAHKSRKKARKVCFAKEALILNAALEGELDVLKDCVKELGSCSQVSDKGATCLHNAVCSGSIEVVQFLIEMGSNINAQDIDGWTPLHCAAAYCNLDMIHYLIDNGASLFLTTQDGETPLKIAIEEYEVQGEGKQEGSQMAVECLHYLIDSETNIGVANNGEVYALFSHTSSDLDELSFNEGELLIISDHGDCGAGEQWWMAVNATGQRGLVPCTFLGPQCRYNVVL